MKKNLGSLRLKKETLLELTAHLDQIAGALNVPTAAGSNSGCGVSCVPTTCVYTPAETGKACL